MAHLDCHFSLARLKGLPKEMDLVGWHRGEVVFVPLASQGHVEKRWIVIDCISPQPPEHHERLFGG
jgi:hypothetical protein